MKIKLYFEKENLIRLAVAVVFAAVLFAVIRFPVWVLFGFGVLYFGIKSLKIELNEKLSWLWSAIMLGTGGIFTAYHIQYLLLDAELRAKISDNKMLLNVLCCLVVFLAVQVFTNNTGLTCLISHIVLLSLAGINYFVYLFRGNEFIFSDLKSIQTGLSVAGNYEFALDERAGYVILLSTLYIAFIRKLHVSFQKRIPMSIVCISLAVLCCVYIGKHTQGVVTETWEQKGSYRNGYILNFVLSIRDCFIAQPDGYSKEAVKELEDQYSKETDTVAGETEKKPTIIVVMSESYADLSVVGNFSTNIDLTPFYDSLEENTIKGHALSSVFGAKTPNSEWEFLTGNSMAFLPSGSVVYQQYITDTPTSLVSNLKNIGYTCVAMHPYYDTGWSRNIVYPNMGFDETHFIDDFDQTKILRDYITDQELYEKIVDRYESKKSNEDLFIMSISMQNHGGYTEKYDNFDEKARMLGINYPDVNQYLSLIHESDSALEYLISYFEQVDRPVLICFFGDHQPALNGDFENALREAGREDTDTDLTMTEKIYTVPYFIWSNYEIPEDYSMKDSQGEDVISTNYLGTLVRKYAGLELSAYDRYRMNQREQIPVFNFAGYMTADGDWYDLWAENSYREWIERYRTVQYYALFDRKRNGRYFVGE